MLFNKLIHFLLKGVYHLLSFCIHLFSELWEHRMICLSWFYRPCKRLLRLPIFKTRLSIFFFRPTVLDRVTNDWRSFLINFLSIRTLKCSYNANKWGVCCVICFFKSCAFRLFTLCCQRVVISWKWVIWVAFHIFEWCMGSDRLDFIIDLCYVFDRVVQLTIVLLHGKSLLNFLNLPLSIILKRLEFIHNSFHMLMSDIKCVQILILRLQRIQLCLWLFRNTFVLTYEVQYERFKVFEVLLANPLFNDFSTVLVNLFRFYMDVIL